MDCSGIADFGLNKKYWESALGNISPVMHGDVFVFQPGIIPFGGGGAGAGAGAGGMAISSPRAQTNLPLLQQPAPPPAETKVSTAARATRVPPSWQHPCDVMTSPSVTSQYHLSIACVLSLSFDVTEIVTSVMSFVTSC